MDNVKKYTRKTSADGGITESYEFNVPPMQQNIPKPVNGDVTFGNPQSHPGEPKGVDTIPAWLSEGEFVMNPEAVEMYGDKIEAMNNHGRIVQAAEGGLIPQYKEDGGVINKLTGLYDLATSDAGRAFRNKVVPSAIKRQMNESLGTEFNTTPSGLSLSDLGRDTQQNLRDLAKYVSKDKPGIYDVNYQTLSEAFPERSNAKKADTHYLSNLVKKAMSRGSMEKGDDIASLLGQFKIEVKDNGDVRIIDNYDFNKKGTKNQDMDAIDLAKNLAQGNSGYGQTVRDLGYYAIPEGTKVPVDINIPADIPDPTGEIPMYACGGKVKYKAEGGVIIDDATLDAMRMQESSGGLNLESELGALGPYQLMPLTYMGSNEEGGVVGYGVPDEMIDPYNEELSRARAKQYLEGIARANPDWDINKVLTAYHSGAGNVARNTLGEVGTRYADEVLAIRDNTNSVPPESGVPRIADPKDRFKAEAKYPFQDAVEAVQNYFSDVSKAETTEEPLRAWLSRGKEEQQLPVLGNVSDGLEVVKDWASDRIEPVTVDLTQTQPTSEAQPVAKATDKFRDEATEENIINSARQQFADKKNYYGKDDGLFDEEIPNVPKAPEEELGFFENLFGKEAVDRTKDTIMSTFDNLFDTNELTKATVLYLGQRALGYSHEGSMEWTAKNYAKQIQGKLSNADKLAATGDHTQKSIEEYRKTGDASVLKAVVEPTDLSKLKTDILVKSTLGGAEPLRIIEAFRGKDGILRDIKTGEQVDPTEYTTYSGELHDPGEILTNTLSYMTKSFPQNTTSETITDKDGNRRTIKGTMVNLGALTTAYSSALRKLYGPRADVLLNTPEARQRLNAYAKAAMNYYDNNNKKSVENMAGLIYAVDSGLYTYSRGGTAINGKPVPFDRYKDVSEPVDAHVKEYNRLNPNAPITIGKASKLALDLKDLSMDKITNPQDRKIREDFGKLVAEDKIPKDMSEDLAFIKYYYTHQQ